ncbi:MAG: nucleotidyltransferase domain-containing protein [Chloroflexota bacterium]|nr:nucleotidyltransferase domain-containing protein [Chloroflexota bacterium]
MTTNTQSADLIPEITERIVRAFHPEKIILFGSHARGDARADSDIDLLVVLREVDNGRRAAAAVLDLLTDLIVPIDAIVATPAEIERNGGRLGTVLRPALLEGKVLYAA